MLLNVDTYKQYYHIKMQGMFTSIHYEHDRQRKRTKYTVPQVDKGTSLHCYYVKRWICMWHLFYTCLHNSSEGMFLCLPEELIFCPLSLSVIFIVISIQKLRLPFLHVPLKSTSKFTINHLVLFWIILFLFVNYMYYNLQHQWPIKSYLAIGDNDNRRLL